jgi:hypothetical protein
MKHVLRAGAIAGLLLALAACRAVDSSPQPSASLPITDLSSFRLTTPTPTPTLSPAATRTQTATPTVVPTATATPSVTLTVTPVPSATRLVAATPYPGCVDGWVSPTSASPRFTQAIEMLEAQMGVSGPWKVDEMRYFTGPDVPWIIEPHYGVVDYWYVKAGLTADPTFHARWLLEQRTDTIRGISAVAPYDTTGYASPDWTGFVGEGTPHIVTGLPGTWSGIPYDFVTGEGDSGQPGLPDEVVGCLSGT